MPFYLYEHPETGEVIEVFQGMNDEHSFTDASGIKYNRIFTAPNAAIDSRTDPFDSQAFVRKTGQMKGGKMGDIWDKAKELSLKRAEKNGGVDPVKQKHVEKYEKEVGAIHSSRIQK